MSNGDKKKRETGFDVLKERRDGEIEMLRGTGNWSLH